jgi:4-hydroxy-tetrahydrodipicolinate reductase
VGAHLVVGATGLDSSELDGVGEMAAASNLGVMYCPNFSVGAVLMMRLSEQVASVWEGSVEIVETHHDGKLDSPSGTAAHTADLLASAGAHSTDGPSSSDTGPARGDSHRHVRIHSLRLPGAVAHQDVKFGAPGEILTISHDALDRSCYAAGVALASRAVRSRHGLTIGLEQIL